MSYNDTTNNYHRHHEKFYPLSLKKRYCSTYVKKVLDLKMTIHAMFFLTAKQEFLRWNLQNIVFGSCYT